MSIGNVPSGDFSFREIEKNEKGDAGPSKADIDEKISGQVGKIASLAESSSIGLSIEGQGKQSSGISRVAMERFRKVAAEKGMTEKEIDHQIRYISQNLDQWIAKGEGIRIKKGGSEGLARTLEFIPDSNTVVTHFKSKNITGIKKPLGEGAHSVVKHSIVTVSEQLEAGADIADKVPKDRTQVGVGKLIREGELTKKLSASPHVRGCYRVNGKGILLEGMLANMSTAMRRGMSDEVKTAAVSGIAKGMAHIHQEGYVHQDLHPGNCFVSSDGVWTIGDLGSAQKADEINTQPINLAIATPDRVSGQIYGTNSETLVSDDIWALGTIFYEMETGNPPPFVNLQRTEAIQDALKQKKGSLEEIKQLSDEEQQLILSWSGEESLKIPDHLEKKKEELNSLTHRFTESKVLLRDLHQSFLKDVAQFHQDFQPQTGFKQLIKKMLDPIASSRISEEELLEFTEKLIPEDFTSRIEMREVEVPKTTTRTQKIFNYSNGSKESEDGIYIYEPGDTETSKAEPVETSESVQLREAAKKGDIEVLRAWLLKGCDVAGWRDAKGRTLLHLAAENNGNVPAINFLLDLGADPNAIDIDGNAPMHVCAKMENIPAGMALLRFGGNTELKNNEGNTPLDLAKDIIYLDENKLLASPWSQSFIGNEPIFVEWYKNQAAMLQFIEDTPGITEEAKEKLLFLSLQAFSKAASFGPERARQNQMQTTPVYPAELRYHRSEVNAFVKAAESLIAAQLYQSPVNIRIVHSPLVTEVLAREFSDSGEVFTISSPKDIERLKGYISDKHRLNGETSRMIVDFTEFLNLEGDSHANMERFTQLWMNAQVLTHRKISPVAVLNQRGQDVLLMPFPQNAELQLKINYSLKSSGFLPSPDETKEAYIKNSSAEFLFTGMKVGKATLTTGIHATKNSKMPTVCDNMEDLLSRNAAKKLAALAADSDAPPYQRVLAEGTINLLRGFTERELKTAFEEEGVGDLLQLSYFKIIEAMGSAVHKKDNLGEYQSQIEIIHQEMQNMLAILSIRHGYGADEFAEAAALKLTSGERPIVPGLLGAPRMSLKPSAIHCLSSTLAAVERQKGSPRLNVVMQKDVYYETAGSLDDAKNYTVTRLDGDHFSSDPSSVGFEKGKAPSEPVDLFICEIRHNISIERKEYNKEDVAGQILAMKKKGLLADRCTVMIDTTIDMERSTDIRDLLENPDIQKLIQDGELNIVAMRSGQKFDMLGMDNYYGGISVTINNGRDFKAFNERMETEEDQLGGLSYQGMTHLQKYAGSSTENYRQALMENTQLMYEAIPKAMIAGDGNDNPIQVSQMNDGKAFFIDVKSPEKYGDLAKKFQSRFNRNAEKKNIPITSRPSFGFPTTNSVVIVNAGIRINPGLEDKETVQRLADIFTEIQRGLDVVMKNAKRFSEDEVIQLVRFVVTIGRNNQKKKVK